MKHSLWTSLVQAVRTVDRWLNDTPERALDQAYAAALKIKALEDEHFGGKALAPDREHFSAHMQEFLEDELKKHLRTTQMRLTEFKASRTIVDSTNSAKVSLNLPPSKTSRNSRDDAWLILEKLRFIDEILGHYQSGSTALTALVPVNPTPSTQVAPSQSASQNSSKSKNLPQPPSEKPSSGMILDQTGVLPRSISNTLYRIKQELDPTAEEDLVQNFRATHNRVKISVRFFLLLIIVPLLTQQLSKTLIISPLVDRFRPPDRSDLFINIELEESALRELSLYRERLEFEELLGRSVQAQKAPSLQSNLPPATIAQPAVAIAHPGVWGWFQGGDTQVAIAAEPESQERSSGSHRPPLVQNPAERSVPEPGRDEKQPSTGDREKNRGEENRSQKSIEEKLRDRAQELAQEYHSRSSDAVKNVFADLTAFGAFGVFLLVRRQDFEVLRSFIDERVYGLSDSAKAFIIILFTDMFVGFHSPHGWEVLLEGVSVHFGLPANKSFNGLFIATFPVILDTIFKYWIFRYLNRISPSAVATYKNMNE